MLIQFTNVLKVKSAARRFLPIFFVVKDALHFGSTATNVVVGQILATLTFAHRTSIFATKARLPITP